MKASAVKSKKQNETRAAATAISQKKSHQKSALGVVDNRPEAIVQRYLQQIANKSSQVKQRKTNQYKIYQLFKPNGNGLKQTLIKSNSVIQCFLSSGLKLTTNKVGRAHNAGIHDENVELGTGKKFTQHFHVNGWKEKDGTFTSFTGTFILENDEKYHYNITDNGDGTVKNAAKAWDREPPHSKMAMEVRTTGKLSDLL